MSQWEVHADVWSVTSWAELRREQAARAAGATIADIGEATGQTFNATGCRSVTDDIALLLWRAQRQAQAVGVVNENNPPDELMKRQRTTPWQGPSATTRTASRPSAAGVLSLGASMSRKETAQQTGEPGDDALDP
ncbi:hypothetical protein [Streptomyces sp. NPDC005181]|uniref:hypothetical protein n=1 Tax=Streptomyces sp. NPDC005181 TaxID=3156869 RepID=UPI00339FD1D7